MNKDPLSFQSFLSMYLSPVSSIPTCSHTQIPTFPHGSSSQLPTLSVAPKWQHASHGQTPSLRDCLAWEGEGKREPTYSLSFASVHEQSHLFTPNTIHLILPSTFDIVYGITAIPGYCNRHHNPFTGILFCHS